MVQCAKAQGHGDEGYSQAKGQLIIDNLFVSKLILQMYND